MPFYIALFYLAYKKYRIITPYNTIIGWFILIPIMGVYLYSTGAYCATFNDEICKRPKMTYYMNFQ